MNDNGKEKQKLHIKPLMIIGINERNQLTVQSRMDKSSCFMLLGDVIKLLSQLKEETNLITPATPKVGL